MEKNDDIEDLEYAKQIKVILVGETGVGKTCIIHRYINGKFNEDTLSTITNSSMQKVITLDDENKTKIELDIWDTCGQEKYRNIVNIYFKDTKAAILVYDSTSKATFNEIKNFWYKKVKEYAPENTSKYIYL